MFEGQRNLRVSASLLQDLHATAALIEVLSKVFGSTKASHKYYILLCRVSACLQYLQL